MHLFARIPVAGDDGLTSVRGLEASQDLWQYLHGADYIDAQGRIQDSLREALKEDSFEPSERFAAQRTEIAEVLRTLAGRLDIKNADERKPVRVRQAVLQGVEFRNCGPASITRPLTAFNSTTKDLSRSAPGRFKMRRIYPGRGGSGARPTSLIG